MMDICSSCCLKSLETGIRGVGRPSPEPPIQDVNLWPAERSVSGAAAGEGVSFEMCYFQ